MPARFQLLANHIAGRSLGVVMARPGESAYTDGRFVYVSSSGTLTEHRREVVVQAALLGAGSLDPALMKTLRGRSKAARRYLALEAHRVLHQAELSLPLVTGFGLAPKPMTASSVESLEVALGRKRVVDPLTWFGIVRPSRLLAMVQQEPGASPTDQDFRLEFDQRQAPPAHDKDDDDDDDEHETVKPKLFKNPLANSSAMTSFLSRILGMSLKPEGGTGASGDMAVRSVRPGDRAGPNARPFPIPLRFVSEDVPSPETGVGGALYPEWDVHANRYRAEWCRVITYPVAPVHDVGADEIEHDEVLRRRLARLGLGPKVVRRRPDGDDLDVDALIDFAVDLQSGHSPNEHIYLERQKLARNLGVLILLDASGSATETTCSGLSVHEHQRNAAATIAVTLEELGDRIGVYGFRSHGRSAVQLLALKPFGRRFDAMGRAQLNHLEPAGFTRMGAAIRHAGELLKSDAGTVNKLLLVLSDGFPYDDAYESGYAESDTRRALEELRGDSVACLCLSIGATTPSDSLDRVFGAASHANAATLAELSPRMDALFLGALKELSVAQSRR